jgi:hypothetical protein
VVSTFAVHILASTLNSPSPMTGSDRCATAHPIQGATNAFKDSTEKCFAAPRLRGFTLTNDFKKKWCCQGGLNSRPLPYQ